MQLLTVVLGRPGTIGFATGLAHPRAPNLWGKQGWYTGQGIIAWDLTHGNYGSTTWTDSFVDSLLATGPNPWGDDLECGQGPTRCEIQGTKVRPAEGQVAHHL